MWFGVNWYESLGLNYSPQWIKFFPSLALGVSNAPPKWPHFFFPTDAGIVIGCSIHFNRCKEWYLKKTILIWFFFKFLKVFWCALKGGKICLKPLDLEFEGFLVSKQWFIYWHIKRTGFLTFFLRSDKHIICIHLHCHGYKSLKIHHGKKPGISRKWILALMQHSLIN